MDLKLLANWSLFRATCSQIRSGGKRLKETGLYPKQFAETVVHFHIGHKVGFQIRVVVYLLCNLSLNMFIFACNCRGL